MLNAPTPFPQIGSYALSCGHDTELVRIVGQGREAGELLVSFPCRLGASGNMTMPLTALQDGTPLSPAETAELDKLEGEFAGPAGRTPRTRRQRERAAHRLQLLNRRIYSQVLERKLRDAGLLRWAA